MKVYIEPDRILTNFLRQYMVDVNASRSGEWIFPDFPRVRDLGDASYPRIGITILTESSDPMAMFDDTQWALLNFQIDVVTKKDLVFTQTVTGEAVGTMSASANSDRLVLLNPPNDSSLTVYHAGTPFGTITKVALDSDFTTPSSLPAGEVEYSLGTGNLNFSGTDVTTYDGEAITADYTFGLEGKKCCQYLARRVKDVIIDNFRTSVNNGELFYPRFLRNEPVPFEEDNGLFRQLIEVRFTQINPGRGC